MNCPERGREYCSATSLHVPQPKDVKGLLLLSTEGFLSPGTGTKNYQCEKPVWVYCLSRCHHLFGNEVVVRARAGRHMGV